MRCRWLRLKNGWKRLLTPLKRHETTIYSCIVVFLLCLSAFFVQDIRNTKEILKLQSEQSVLLVELQEVNEFALNQIETMRGQQLLIGKYENTLQSAKDTLDDQSRLIQDLVNYLKKINHWPPKEPRPVPNRSEAAYVKGGNKL